jgi:neutral ceramidase
MLLVTSIFAGAPVHVRAALRAGAAEGGLDAPIGLPLAGYTERALLFGFQRPDARAAPLTAVFAPSTAVQSRPGVKAVALSAGEATLVLVKVDLIFSDAYLLRAVEDLAMAASGESLRGRIVLAASHSHNSPGRFTQNTALMAGADTYDEATFRRYASSIAGVVVAALAAREDARIGIGIDPEFDPLGRDAIFRDRRPENDHLAPDGTFLLEPDGVRVDLDAPGAQGPDKDPALMLLRVDRADGEPLAAVLHFGIHGTALGAAPLALDSEHLAERHLWVSGEAGSAVEWKLEESFRRRVVVMHLQGAAGDVAPAADDLGHAGFARLEQIGERAREGAARLWRETPTASEIELRVVTRAVAQDAEAIRVDRGGAVEWRYPAEPPSAFDGDVLSFEDWTHPLGAGLCGGKSFGVADGVEELAPEERAQVDTDPTSASFGRGLVYGSCLPVDDSTFYTFSSLLDPTFDPELDLPIPESLSTLVTAAALDGVPLWRSGSGATSPSRVLLAAAPGEPTTDWSGRLRQRAKAELDFDEAFVVGYAQDHEGYLLLPEDWLSGGATEVQVNLWGPLQGEYLLERLLEHATLVATPASVDPDPGAPDPPPAVWSFAPPVPRATPLAGTPLQQPDAQVERLHTVSFEWIGGDPVIDQPRIVLQRRSRDGSYRDLHLPSGRPFDDRTHRIVQTYRPEPINARPAQIQQHRYRAWFQVVDDLPTLADVAGFPRGRYRFRVEGERFDGSAQGAYEVVSDPFTIVATDDFAFDSLASDARRLCGRVVLPAAAGFRLESVSAPAGEPIPVEGVLVHGRGGVFAWTDADGRFELPALEAGSSLVADDWFGNHKAVPVPDATPPGCGAAIP